MQGSYYVISIIHPDAGTYGLSIQPGAATI